MQSIPISDKRVALQKPHRPSSHLPTLLSSGRIKGARRMQPLSGEHSVHHSFVGDRKKVVAFAEKEWHEKSDIGRHMSKSLSGRLEEVATFNWWQPYYECKDLEGLVGEHPKKDGTNVDKARAIVEFPFKAWTYSTLYGLKTGLLAADEAVEDSRKLTENYPPFARKLSRITMPIMAFGIWTALGVGFMLNSLIDETQGHLNARLRK